jgi:hypothetical protein
VERFKPNPKGINCLHFKLSNSGAQVKIRNLNDTGPRIALRDLNRVSGYLYPLGLNLEGIER